MLQGHFLVVEYNCLKMVCNSKMAGHREKRENQILDACTLVGHMRCIFDLEVTKVIFFFGGGGRLVHLCQNGIDVEINCLE